ncbi:NADP-dependent oxidoreductase [Conyzicola nivalis]|uniref:NADPH:quinone reductase n=1 Tax=Conyzicola nivalis TaxID=1477021 RepID=A0A916SBE8_9MICO|nr:NADP-dependent oxidoreductase [Conyzicola nivalis]GGA92326.1 NADPH:quinone reductase [Conyzicola nivalis]
MSLAVRYSQFGSPDVLRVVDVDEPHAGEGQVRVAVRAAGLNAYDYKVRRGGYVAEHALPSGQGAEFAGVVDEVGDGVDDVSSGDEVLGYTSFAAQAEYVVVRAANVAPKPAGLDWAVAAGIGLVGNAARRSTDSLALTADDTVIVTAAAGGVGLLATQFARATGATVIGTASEPNHDLLRSLGAIPVAYGDGELERLRAAAPHGYTAMLDNSGPASVRIGLELGIAPSRINSIVDFDTPGIGNVGGGRKSRAELVELARQTVTGELVFPILATFPLARVADAYRRFEERSGPGKIVLTVP